MKVPRLLGFLRFSGGRSFVEVLEGQDTQTISGILARAPLDPILLPGRIAQLKHREKAEIPADDDVSSFQPAGIIKCQAGSETNRCCPVW